jgi:hypothetical protein
MRQLCFATAIGLSTLLTPTAPLAQVISPTAALPKSKTTAFFMGASYDGNAITTANSSTTESGTGGGLTIGYGFNNQFAVYGAVNLATINADAGGTYGLVHVDLGARVHFRSGPNVVVPFIQGALSARTVSTDFGGTTVSGSGGGVSLGAGLNIHTSPHFALTPAITWTVGTFDQFAVNNTKVSDGSSVDATSARVSLGWLWFP